MDDFGLAGLRFTNMVQTITSFIFDKIGMDKKAEEIRAGMLSLEDINRAGTIRKEQRLELRKLREEQEAERTILNARLKALERFKA